MPQTSSSAARRPFPRLLSGRTQRLLAVLWLASAAGCGFNEVVEADVDVEKAFSEVQNQYKRRADLVPQIIGTVKGAAKFEQETLTKVTEARAKVGTMQLDSTMLDDPEKLRAFEKAQQGLGGAIGRLMVVAEKYPELRATSQFRDLQVQLEGTENRIAVARGRYNDRVAVYNKVVQVWPSAFGAMLRGKKVRPNFEAPAGSDVAPTVQF